MRVLAAHVAQQPFRRVAFAVVLLRPVALHNRLRRQREDLALVWMHQHRAQHLMGVRRAAVAMVLLAAVRTMHVRGGEVSGPVHRQQIVPVQTGEPLQPLPPLQPRKHALEHRAQLSRVHRIETRAQRRVARCALNPVQPPQIRPDHLIGPRIAVELQQRRILQPEHRQPRHQVLGEAKSSAGHRVVQLLEAGAHLAQQARRAQSLPQQPLSHDNSPVADE